jgi:2'-5' RNA ligase superfamily
LCCKDPAEPVHAIRAAIRAGMASAWGADRVPDADDGFRAHVSIGYINRPGPAEPIIHTVRNIHPAPATITVRTASLIELHRDRRVYEWRTVQEVPLGR